MNSFSSFLKLCLSFCFVFYTFANSIYAERATDADMHGVCQAWLNSMVANEGGWAGSLVPDIVDSADIVVDVELLGRCYYIDPQGFIIVPILRDLPPIKMYSTKGRLDVGQNEGVAGLIKEVLFDRINAFRKVYGSLDVLVNDKEQSLFDPANKALWDDLLSKGRLDQWDIVGPLMTSNWHQRPPYRNHCPAGDSGWTLVGCVATAAAQVMKYWQWPSSGAGWRSYTWDGDNSCDPYHNTGADNLFADFRDPYNWSLMPDSFSGSPSNWNPSQVQAVANLCREVAIAYRMDFGSCASTAYVDEGVNYLPNYFKYRDNIAVRNRAQYTANSWFDTIKTEINAGRPILYRIKPLYDIGHAIVCDGWKGNIQATIKQYHMNYGFTDSTQNYDIWYSLDGLDCFEYNCDLQNEYMLTNIMPICENSNPNQWDETYRYEVYDRVQDIVSTPDGGCVALINGTSGLTDKSIHAVKYDSTGCMVWDYRWTQDYSCVVREGYRIIFVTDGGYVITGAIDVPEDFKCLFIKISNSGIEQWVRTYGGSDAGEALEARGIIETPDGKLLTVVDGPTLSGPSIMCLNQNGDSLWTRHYGEGTTDARAIDIIKLPHGQYAVSCYEVNNNHYDAVVLRLDSNYNKIWLNTYEIPDKHILPYSIMLSNDTCIILGGTETELDYGLNNGFLYKISLDGSVCWYRAIGDAAMYEKVNYVIKSSDGGYLLAGDEYASGGDYDLFLAKTNECGYLQWVEELGITDINDGANCVAFNGESSAIIGGWINNEVHSRNRLVKISDFEQYLCGDVTGDGLVNIIDIIALIDYKFKGGPPPAVLDAGDVDCDTSITVLDILDLIDYINHDGDAPCSCH